MCPENAEEEAGMDACAPRLTSIRLIFRRCSLRINTPPPSSECFSRQREDHPPIIGDHSHPLEPGHLWEIYPAKEEPRDQMDQLVSDCFVLNLLDGSGIGFSAIRSRPRAIQFVVHLFYADF